MPWSLHQRRPTEGFRSYHRSIRGISMRACSAAESAKTGKPKPKPEPAPRPKPKPMPRPKPTPSPNLLSGGECEEG